MILIGWRWNFHGINSTIDAVVGTAQAAAHTYTNTILLTPKWQCPTCLQYVGKYPTITEMFYFWILRTKLMLLQCFYIISKKNNWGLNDFMLKNTVLHEYILWYNVRSMDNPAVY